MVWVGSEQLDPPDMRERGGVRGRGGGSEGGEGEGVRGERRRE